MSGSKRWAGMAVTGTVLVMVAGGCATARPDFERRFLTGVTGRPHDLWVGLLETRYGCDTVFVKAQAPSWPPRVGLRDLSPGVPGRSVHPGMDACDLAGIITPEVVRAWHTQAGLREEWLYRTTADGPVSSVFLEGPSERGLRVATTAR